MTFSLFVFELGFFSIEFGVQLRNTGVVLFLADFTGIQLFVQGGFFGFGVFFVLLQLLLFFGSHKVVYRSPHTHQGIGGGLHFFDAVFPLLQVHEESFPHFGGHPQDIHIRFWKTCRLFRIRFPALFFF